jgi:hypothetical protein
VRELTLRSKNVYDFLHVTTEVIWLCLAAKLNSSTTLVERWELNTSRLKRTRLLTRGTDGLVVANGTVDPSFNCRSTFTRRCMNCNIYVRCMNWLRMCYEYTRITCKLVLTRRHHETRIRLLQRVFLRGQLNRKLKDRQLGHLTLLEKICAKNYRFELPFIVQLHPMFHVNNLRPCTGGSSYKYTYPAHFRMALRSRHPPLSTPSTPRWFPSTINNCY